MKSEKFATAQSCNNTISAIILGICFLIIIAVAIFSLFTIHFYFPIRDALSHIVVPLFLSEVALNVLADALGNDGQGYQIFADSAVMFARPDVVLVAVEGEIVQPAVGLEQRDRFDLHLAGHPEE